MKSANPVLQLACFGALVAQQAITRGEIPTGYYTVADLEEMGIPYRTQRRRVLDGKLIVAAGYQGGRVRYRPSDVQRAFPELFDLPQSISCGNGGGRRI